MICYLLEELDAHLHSPRRGETHAMTVDDFHPRVRAQEMRVSNDSDAPEERWRDLAHLKDGRREKWMTDRAKNALGTSK